MEGNPNPNPNPNPPEPVLVIPDVLKEHLKSAGLSAEMLSEIESTGKVDTAKFHNEINSKQKDLILNTPAEKAVLLEQLRPQVKAELVTQLVKPFGINSKEAQGYIASPFSEVVEFVSGKIKEKDVVLEKTANEQRSLELRVNDLTNTLKEQAMSHEKEKKSLRTEFARKQAVSKLALKENQEKQADSYLDFAILKNGLEMDIDETGKLVLFGPNKGNIKNADGKPLTTDEFIVENLKPFMLDPAAGDKPAPPPPTPPGGKTPITPAQPARQLSSAQLEAQRVLEENRKRFGKK